MDLSHIFLEFVAEHSRDPILEFSDQGILQQANRATWQLFGWSEGDEIRLRDLRLYTDEQQLLTLSFLQQQPRKISKPIVVSYMPIRTDKPLLFRLSIERSGSRSSPVYFLMLTPPPGDEVDIEDYQLAEEKFYKAFHLSPDAISITRLSDGLVLEVNQGFVQLTGYSREELIGRTSTEVNFWSDPRQREQMKVQLQSEGECVMEAKFRIKGGELAEGHIRARVISIRGETCLISVVRDLREQKAAQRAQRESENRLQVINQATNDAIWDWDMETAEVWRSDGMQRIFGYTPEEVGNDLGWWEQLIHQDDRERVMERLQHFIQLGGGNWFDKYRFIRKDGSYAYVYDKGHIITNGQGKPVRMIGGMVDITDRVLAEESLLIRNRQIAEYSFFNSHKVRGPLSRLLGLTTILQLEETGEEEKKKLLAKIRITAEELDDMIRDITKMFY
ncbi:MAG: PAS domain S-box protein [Cyclobacteriaceae bacterium]